MQMVYVHVPKTGGRVLKLACHNLFMEVRQIKVDKIEITNPHLTLAELKSCKDCFIQGNFDQNHSLGSFTWQDDYIPFTICRSPYTWLESFFYYHFTEDAPLLSLRGKPQLYADFEQFVLAQPFAEEVHLPVRRFIAEKQVPLQTDWTMGIDVEHIIKLENIYEDIGRVLPGANTEKIKKIHTENVLYVSSTVRRVKKTKEKWSRKMRDIVNEYFHRDFEYYGYEKL